MWFLNKKTGVKWEIVDKELIDKLSKDDNYEEIKETQKVEEKKEVKKTTSKKSK